jgi:hypothetical protein
MSGRLLQLYAAAVISLGVLVVLWYWGRGAPFLVCSAANKQVD